MFLEVPIFYDHRTAFDKGQGLSLYHEKVVVKFDKIFKNV